MMIFIYKISHVTRIVDNKKTYPDKYNIYINILMLIYWITKTCKQCFRLIESRKNQSEIQTKILIYKNNTHFNPRCFAAFSHRNINYKILYLVGKRTSLASWSSHYMSTFLMA